MNNRNLLTPTNNDIKRGFGRSDQWKELLNVTKPLYYMNAKVMSKICARKTQQDAYTRQMMLFQQMRAVLIGPRGPRVVQRTGGDGGASSLGNNFALFVTIFFYRCPRRNQYVSIFRRKLYCGTRIICVDHTSVGFLLFPT